MERKKEEGRDERKNMGWNWRLENQRRLWTQENRGKRRGSSVWGNNRSFTVEGPRGFRRGRNGKNETDETAGDGMTGLNDSSYRCPGTIHPSHV